MVVIHGYAKEEVTMQDVLRQLEIEFRDNPKEAFSIFEWYCQTYRVDIGDVAPTTIRYEVFGF